jgi:hypothetical protein
LTAALLDEDRSTETVLSAFFREKKEEKEKKAGFEARVRERRGGSKSEMVSRSTAKQQQAGVKQ